MDRLARPAIVLGDCGNYDSSKLHGQARQYGAWLFTPLKGMAQPSSYQYNQMSQARRLVMQLWQEKEGTLLVGVSWSGWNRTNLHRLEQLWRRLDPAAQLGSKAFSCDSFGDGQTGNLPRQITEQKGCCMAASCEILSMAPTPCLDYQSILVPSISPNLFGFQWRSLSTSIPRTSMSASSSRLV